MESYLLNSIYLSLQTKQINAVILAPLGVKRLCKAFFARWQSGPGVKFWIKHDLCNVCRATPRQFINSKQDALSRLSNLFLIIHSHNSYIYLLPPEPRTSICLIGTEERKPGSNFLPVSLLAGWPVGGRLINSHCAQIQSVCWGRRQGWFLSKLKSRRNYKEALLPLRWWIPNEPPPLAAYPSPANPNDGIVWLKTKKRRNRTAQTIA